MPRRSTNRVELPVELEREVAGLCAADARVRLRRAEALRILLDQDGYAEQQYLAGGGSADALREARGRLTLAGANGPAAEVQARYRWIDAVLDGVITRSATPRVTWTDRIDRVLTHRVGGAVFLLLVLFVVFESLFRWAAVGMERIDWLFEHLSELVASALPAGALQSLVTDGIIAARRGCSHLPAAVF